MSVGDSVDATSMEDAMALTERLSRVRASLGTAEMKLREAAEAGAMGHHHHSGKSGQARRPPVPDRTGRVSAARGLDKRVERALKG